MLKTFMSSNAASQRTETPRPIAPPALPTRATEAPEARHEKNMTPPSPTASGDEGSKLIVGPNIKLKGSEITDCEILVVEGRVEASMNSRDIRIAEGGVFAGRAEIDVAEIHGTFEGDLVARKRLVVYATGRVKGTIRYGAMMVESGGVISGNIGLHNAPAQLTDEIAGQAGDEKPNTDKESAEAGTTSGKRSRFG